MIVASSDTTINISYGSSSCDDIDSLTLSSISTEVGASDDGAAVGDCVISISVFGADTGDSVLSSSVATIAASPENAGFWQSYGYLGLPQSKWEYLSSHVSAQLLERTKSNK